MTDQPEWNALLLLARAERAFGGRELSEALPRVKAIVPPGAFPQGEAEAARALRQLRGEEAGAPSDRDLEALVRMICVMRPSLLTDRGALPPLPTEFGFAPEVSQRWDAFTRRIRPCLFSVGRLDRAGGGNCGTGFLVAPGLLLTNLHVVRMLFGGSDFVANAAVVHFQMERNHADTEDAVSITGLVPHPTLDLAMLHLGAYSERPVFSVAAAQPASGEPVAVIGYPSADDQRNPLFARRVFGGAYDVKHVAPGEVTGARPPRVFHDCATLGGSSGSPLLAQDSGDVLGIHYDAAFLQRNIALDGPAVMEFVAQHRP